MDDEVREQLTEFLDGLSPEEHMALSDASAERLEHLAQLAYADAKERLNEFRAAHPEFCDPEDA
jgi:hypothetical protein